MECILSSLAKTKTSKNIKGNRKGFYIPSLLVAKGSSRKMLVQGGDSLVIKKGIII